MNIIMNISGVYDDECWSIPGATTLDFRNLDGCNCYCCPEAASAFRSALAALPLQGIHWIDTGDYHYLSKLWMEKVDEPFALVLFDNHPDDQPDAFGSGMLSCGGWVAEAARDIPALKAKVLNGTAVPAGLPVYLSIDLDVMPREYARTDWTQGEMSLESLLSAVDRISAKHRILGVDICGGLTVAKGATAEDLSVNSGTRDALAAYFSSHPLLAGYR